VLILSGKNPKFFAVYDASYRMFSFATTLATKFKVQDWEFLAKQQECRSFFELE
jgi:hypothetical protein